MIIVVVVLVVLTINAKRKKGEYSVEEEIEQDIQQQNEQINPVYGFEEKQFDLPKYEEI